MDNYRSNNRNGYNNRIPVARNNINSMNSTPLNNSYINSNQPAPPLAMAYVHMQNWCDLYSPEKGFHEGTIFPNLNLVFCGVRGKM